MNTSEPSYFHTMLRKRFNIFQLYEIILSLRFFAYLRLKVKPRKVKEVTSTLSHLNYRTKSYQNQRNIFKKARLNFKKLKKSHFDRAHTSNDLAQFWALNNEGYFDGTLNSLKNRVGRYIIFLAKLYIISYIINENFSRVKNSLRKQDFLKESSKCGSKISVQRWVKK